MIPLFLFFFFFQCLGDSRVTVTDHSKVYELQSTIQILQMEKVESTKKIEDLENKIKEIHKRLSSAEHDQEVWKKEQERLEVEKRWMTEQCEPVKLEHCVAQQSALRQSESVSE